jgi:membrane-associated phospholipid phosphatase
MQRVFDFLWATFPLGARHGWRWRAAVWISFLLSPPIVLSAALLLLAWTINSPPAWLWAGYLLLLSVLAPSLFILWMVRMRKITDVEIVVREQRFLPYLLSLGCAFASFQAAELGSAPKELGTFASANFALQFFLFFITLGWKISAHAAAASTTAILVFSMFGPLAFPILFVIPLVAWSRVVLYRHTPSQVIAGSFLGGLIGLLMFLWI